MAKKRKFQKALARLEGIQDSIDRVFGPWLDDAKEPMTAAQAVCLDVVFDIYATAYDRSCQGYLER
jgi:hypothetical protein